jgi:carboxyl-terminal processing protease
MQSSRAPQPLWPEQHDGCILVKAIMPWALEDSHVASAEGPLARKIAELAQREARRANPSGMNLPGRFGHAGRPLRVVFPTELGGLSEADAFILRGLPALFEIERHALESELGAVLDLEAEAEAPGARWLVGPGRCNPELARLGFGEPPLPVVRRLSDRELLITDASDVEGLFEGLSLLRSFAWSTEDELISTPCDNVEGAFLRVAEEIAHTWPSFRRRGICWIDLCCESAGLLSRSAQPLATLQALAAQLGDAHTAVRSADRIWPARFRARAVGRELVLHEVPPTSAAWHAGAREGFRLEGFDLGCEWPTIGATPHHRPFAVPFRLSCGAAGTKADFRAVGPGGARAHWTEHYRPPSPADVVSWQHLPSGAGYLRIERWLGSSSMDELIDRALSELAGAPGLVVDLRGNPGGNVAAAVGFRDRFLRARTHLGSIAFSAPDGELTPPRELWAEPAPLERRWPSPVRFLTDGGTYSASEDALLGLQGLAHVEVLGMASGGGSGRARNISLLPGWRLTVSSCLTFDREGRCVEGAGIPVDQTIPMDQRGHTEWSQQLLAAADRGW